MKTKQISFAITGLMVFGSIAGLSSCKRPAWQYTGAGLAEAKKTVRDTTKKIDEFVLSTKKVDATSDTAANAMLKSMKKEGEDGQIILGPRALNYFFQNYVDSNTMLPSVDHMLQYGFERNRVELTDIISAKLQDVDWISPDFSAALRASNQSIGFYANCEPVDGGYHLRGDFDFRNKITQGQWNQYFSENTDARITKNASSNEIEGFYKSSFRTEDNGEFIVSGIDFLTGAFVFLQGQRGNYPPQDLNKPAEEKMRPFCDLFNAGEATLSKVVEYRYCNVVAIKGRVNPKDLTDFEYEGYNFIDYDQAPEYNFVFKDDATFEKMESVWNDVYKDVREKIILRGNDQALSRDKTYEMDLEDISLAFRYGASKTEVADYGDSAAFLFLDQEDYRNAVEKAINENSSFEGNAVLQEIQEELTKQDARTYFGKVETDSLKTSIIKGESAQQLRYQVISTTSNLGVSFGFGKDGFIDLECFSC